MAKVITFSRQFPSYHPRAGEPTYFVEQIWNGYRDDMFALPDSYVPFVREYVRIKQAGEVFHFGGIKHHTIRAGHRWKAGDWLSPRVWSGKPYRSKMIQFAPDIQVKKVWDVEVDECDIWAIGLPGTQVKYLDDDQCARISLNDGLTEQDMYWWFKEAKKPFVGQVICWNESIEY